MTQCVRIPLSIALFCISATPALADNWAHWRGDGNGTSATANPPTNWSGTENVKWKVPIPGRGSGSPIIWEDKVFVVSAVPTSRSGTGQASGGPGAGRPEGRPGGGRPGAGRPGGGRQGSGRQGGGRPSRGRGFGGPPIEELQFQLFCFDRNTGKLQWKKTAVTATPHQGTHSTNGFASASPCTDGKHVYAHFGSRGLFCYTLDGDLVWSRTDLGKMETRNSFGEGSSPTLAGDLLLVPWDHEGPSSLWALDKTTGKTIWNVKRDEPTCWATPLVVEHAGRQQVVMNGQNYARAYDLETGKELWRCGGQTERPVASAVTIDDIVLIGSGYRGSFLGAFKLGGSGDLRGTKNVVWSVNSDTPDIASPLLSEGRIYFHKAKTGILSCHDAKTGKVHFSATRVPGLDSIYASPIAAGGHIYLTARNGTTVVIKDSAEFEIVATNNVGETVDATPAPVDNELFIRGESHLFCIAQ